MLAAWPNVHDSRIAVVTDGEWMGVYADMCSCAHPDRLADPRPGRSRRKWAAHQHRKAVRARRGLDVDLIRVQGSLHCGRGHQAHIDRTSGVVLRALVTVMHY